jgi:hypothetical protein
MIDLFFILFTTGMVMIVVVRAMVMDRLIPWFSPSHLVRAAAASANWLVGAFPALRLSTDDQLAVPPPASAEDGWRARTDGDQPRGNVAGWRERAASAKPEADLPRGWRDRVTTQKSREDKSSRAPTGPIGGWRKRVKQDGTR